MKILFLVPDGVGIRNYLYSNILKDLTDKGHEIVVWHALSESALGEVESLHDIRLDSEPLPPYKESMSEKFLRESISYARLRHNTHIVKNQTLMTNWAPSIRNFRLKLFYKAVEITGSAFNSDKAILKMEGMYDNRVKKSAYLQPFSDFLKRHNPDVVFNTHQRSIIAVPAVLTAQMSGIKTITAIYSWDNLPKARLATRTDGYCVWSEYMKNEMQMYYPEIEEASIVVTGTPQFDFYHDKSLYWDKELFCQKYDLDPKRKIICFSGDDTRTSPYDPEYLADLAEAVEQMEKSKRPQILFRRCPADFSNRYDEVLKRYKDVIKVSDPLWNRDEGENWNLFYPSFEDVALLVNIAFHCDTVYNVGSTMAHDFAMFDKPACYIKYDQTDSEAWSVETIYRFQHFKSMEGLDAVVWINSKEEMAEKVLRVLEHPDEVAVDRKKWLNIITESQQNVSKRIAAFLTEG
ncbi:hypothetical protein [Sulfurovum sp.]|uniref:hypothetical protein n=1 Tax=Sulfurovum sp. TaxID=1969726 RepID=UPI0025E37423|nr:hypothetical protein [Sulfurovum sp.]